MQVEFLPPVDAAQLAGRGMRRSYLRVADAGIIALIELVKFYQNYRAGFGVDGDLSEILKDFDEPSNLRAEFAIVKALAQVSTLKWHSSSGSNSCAALSPQQGHSGRWF